MKGGGWSTAGLGFDKLNQEWWDFPTEAIMVYRIRNRVLLHLPSIGFLQWESVLFTLLSLVACGRNMTSVFQQHGFKS